MSNYRIVEKTGRWKTRKEVGLPCPKTGTEAHDTRSLCSLCSIDKTVYVPLYVLQKLTYRRHGPIVSDLVEFNDLDEARLAKRNLELKDGIVIE